MNRRIDIDMQVRLPRGHTADRSPHRLHDNQGRIGGAEKADARTGETQRLCATLKESHLKTYGSRELFDGSREVGIEHGGSLYRLKITRQGKLILNK
ncbi:hemin uptake protein HemP [Brucella sp. BE17]|uniref:hemin uptake protein HemP n=1 Tax=Brucella sp. BE17 TaxID=3142977 RepID=UPI0031BA50F4